MKLNDISIRIDELILKGENILRKIYFESGSLERINVSDFAGLKSATKSLIIKIYDNNHPYYSEIENITHYQYPSAARKTIAILKEIKDEITGGWLFSTKGIVAAEIFSDFIEMSNYLLEEGYKDSSAVMLGSVLEEHLRQLCLKNGIEIFNFKNEKSIPKKADLLNSELSSKNIYNKLDQKNVTAWLDLRNNAAHGKYDEYSKEQVEIMFSAISDFLSRNPI
jgi:hypothetical protein